jgi:hypothetical protein
MVELAFDRYDFWKEPVIAAALKKDITDRSKSSHSCPASMKLTISSLGWNGGKGGQYHGRIP